MIGETDFFCSAFYSLGDLDDDDWDETMKMAHRGDDKVCGKAKKCNNLVSVM